MYSLSSITAGSLIIDEKSLSSKHNYPVSGWCHTPN